MVDLKKLDRATQVRPGPGCQSGCDGEAGGLSWPALCASHVPLLPHPAAATLLPTPALQRSLMDRLMHGGEEGNMPLLRRMAERLERWVGCVGW